MAQLALPTSSTSGIDQTHEESRPMMRLSQTKSVGLKDASSAHLPLAYSTQRTLVFAPTTPANVEASMRSANHSHEAYRLAIRDVRAR
jgi:hypothetical protein